MKTIKMTVELMVNDKADTILGIAGYSPEAINSDLLEKIMREVKGMGERLSKGYEEKSCPCCQCNGCDCEEDEEEELIEEEEDEVICPLCGFPLYTDCRCEEEDIERRDKLICIENGICPICGNGNCEMRTTENGHHIAVCIDCDYIEVIN